MSGFNENDPLPEDWMGLENHPVIYPDGLSDEDRSRIDSAAKVAGSLALDLPLSVQLKNGQILKLRFSDGAWR